MKNKRFIKKVKAVDAVRVSMEHIKGIASWCGGTVESLKNFDNAIYFVKVAVAGNDWDAISIPAYSGDWIVKNHDGTVKVVSSDDFENDYKPVKTNDEKLDLARTLVLEAMGKQDVATYFGASSEGMDLVARDIAKRIVEGLED